MNNLWFQKITITQIQYINVQQILVFTFEFRPTAWCGPRLHDYVLFGPLGQKVGQHWSIGWSHLYRQSHSIGSYSCFPSLQWCYIALPGLQAGACRAYFKRFQVVGHIGGEKNWGAVGAEEVDSGQADMSEFFSEFFAYKHAKLKINSKIS